MSTKMTVYREPTAVIVPGDATKDRLHRLAKYARWLASNARPWYKPDLEMYRDALLASYKPSSVSAHLSTIRARYRELLRDRDRLYAIAAQRTDEPLERKAIVDELVTRIENAIDPEAVKVKVKVKQDRADSEHLRLTSEQASALLAAPGVATLRGLRDTATIALMLCTGIRESELVALDVADLRVEFGGELSLHVRDGKGCKERLIPYGELSWCLAIIDKWLDAAGIQGGPVLRGFYKDGRTLRPGRLSVRSVQYILASYQIMVNGKLATVKPHDCRRTYARRLYVAGVDLVAIQQNLGHADVKTTLGYIGTLDAKARRAPSVYSFDLNGLARVAVQGRLGDATA